MSDGQTFYVVLALFYYLECLKFAPPDSLAMISPLGGTRKWRPKQRLMVAWGLGKSVFIGPLLPWPSLIFVVSGSNAKSANEKRVQTVSGVRREVAFLKRSTASLRGLSLVHFLIFFAALPLLYWHYGDHLIVLATVGLAYLLLFATAIHFSKLHKRILPEQSVERLKATLYTAFLPWHAMRCADEIITGRSLSWNPLAVLAANADNGKTLAILQKLWRESRHLSNPRYPTEAIEALLRIEKLDTTDWITPPKQLESPQYCPCCHTGYENQATHCVECPGVELLSSVPQERSR